MNLHTNQIKNNIRRLAAMALCLLLLLTSACSRNRLTLDESEKLVEDLYGVVDLGSVNDINNVFDTPSPNFTLPYSRTGMSQIDLNPYFCTSTLNDTLCHLVYDRLLYLDSEFHPVMEIAHSVEMTDSKTVTVVLRGVVFSDGSVLTGGDVVFSFEEAKKSPKFSAQLAHFESCTFDEATPNMVVFQLAESDMMAGMNLDFPIIKKFSDRKNPEAPSTDPQNDRIPVGSGRYYYYSDIEHGSFLLRNKRWYGIRPSAIERISLVGMPTMESIIHSIEIGTISYYFADLRDGYLYIDSHGRPSNRFGGNYATVDLNHLVLLGVNTFDPRLQNREVRAALSFAINREDICSGVFGGRAYGATGPFPTSWPEAAEAQYRDTLNDEPQFITSIQSAGYINRSEQSGVRYNNLGQYLNFNLLVTATNAQHLAAANALALQLRNYGIGITVAPVSKEELAGRIYRGEYELYLGEYALMNNMDIQKLITPGLGLYSGPAPETTVQAWKGFKSGGVALEDFVDAFESDIPFIPVCYRLGMVCYTRGVSANMNVTQSNLFLDMDTWEVIETVTGTDVVAKDSV